MGGDQDDLTAHDRIVLVGLLVPVMSAAAVALVNVWTGCPMCW